MISATSMSRLTPVNIQVESRPGVRLGQTASSQKSNGVQSSFSEYLKGSINDVNHTQLEANDAVTAMVTGRSHNIHETMIALDKAMSHSAYDQGSKQGRGSIPRNHANADLDFR